MSNSQNFIENNKKETPDKDQNLPKEESIKDKLLNIAQIARKTAYWLDNDSELPNGFINTINVITEKMNQMNKFITDQMIDVSDTLDEEVKSVPTKPDMWSKVKKSNVEKHGENSTWHANKEYKENGGNWRKKKRKKTSDY